MQLLIYISNFIIPLFIFYIVGYGLLNKNNVYDDFVKGAKDGMKTVAGILPTLIGLMVAVGILRASGFLEWLCALPGGLTEKIGFPSQLLPVTIVRMFSSSAATGLVLDIFKEYGTDSGIGLITSIMMSCTDNRVILRGSEEYLQRQGLEFILIFYLSPVVLDWQLNNMMRNYKQRKDGMIQCCKLRERLSMNIWKVLFLCLKRIKGGMKCQNINYKCTVKELAGWFHTHFQHQALDILDGLQKRNLISYLSLDRGKVIKLFFTELRLCFAIVEKCPSF